MKKIAQDKHSATFRNKDGHEIKVAISSLSPEMKKKLDQLPIHAAEGTDTGDVNPLPAPIRPGPGMSSDKDLPEDYRYVPDQIDRIRDTFQQVLPNAVDRVDPSQVAASANQEAHQSIGPKAEAATAGSTGSSHDPVSAAAPYSSQQQPGSLAPQEVSAEPDQMPQAKAPATAQPSMERSPSASTVSLPAPRTPEEAAQQTVSGINQKVQDFRNDVSAGHISPKTYHDMMWKNPDGTEKGALGKIKTIFGLILGGIGSGLTHQPNVLLEAMNKEIERDLESQKASATNAFNLHNLSLQHEKMEYEKKLAESQIPVNSAQAQLLKTQMRLQNQSFERVAMGDAAISELRKTVETMPPSSPQYQKAQELLQGVAQMSELKNQSVINQAGAHAAMIHGMKDMIGSAGDSEQQFAKQNMIAPMIYGPPGAAIAKERKEGHVPGFSGTASTPVTSDDREKLRNMQNFDQAVRNVRDWAQKHSGLGNQLNLADRSYGRTQLMNLQSLYREGQGMGQLKGFDVPLLEKEIGTDPMSILNSIGNDKKLQAAQEANAMKMNIHAKSLGLPPAQNQQRQSQAPVRGKDGHMYIQQGKYMVPVK